jgi:Ca2+-binding EF-hand superfamily protein
VRRVFRQFDLDGNGEIDRSELEAVFKEMGMNVPGEEIERIIKAAGHDESQTINYDEFVKHCRFSITASRLRQKFWPA